MESHLGRNLGRFGCPKGSQTAPEMVSKSIQNGSKGGPNARSRVRINKRSHFFNFLIDFDVDFKRAQEGPKTVQDAQRRRSKGQDGPKRSPRRRQESPRRPQEFARRSCFFDLGRQELPSPPRDSNKSDFWSFFNGFLMDFRLIFHFLN